MKDITRVFLALGFIWCGYDFILGVISPEQAEYANNMSELIVAVLTVVSIAFAFSSLSEESNAGAPARMGAFSTEGREIVEKHVETS